MKRMIKTHSKALLTVLILTLLLGALTALTGCYKASGKLNANSVILADNLNIQQTAMTNTASANLYISINITEVNYIGDNDYKYGDNLVGAFSMNIYTDAEMFNGKSFYLESELPSADLNGRIDLSKYMLVNIVYGAGLANVGFSGGTALILDNSKQSEQTVKYVYVVRPPDNPTKEGYTFDGWYLDEACTIPYGSAPIYEDTVFYAGWIINTYTITYVNNNGQQNVIHRKQYKQAVENITPLEKEGYNFGGWYTDAACTQVYDFNSTLKNDVTLYAKWAIKTYKVTFVVDGAVLDTIIVTHGSKIGSNSAAAIILKITDNIYTDELMLLTYNLETEITSDLTVYSVITPRMEKWINFGEFFFNGGYIALAAGLLCIIGLTALITAKVKG